ARRSQRANAEGLRFLTRGPRSEGPPLAPLCLDVRLDRPDPESYRVPTPSLTVVTIAFRPARFALGGRHDGRDIVKYMLLIYGDEHALSQAEREKCYRESTDLAHQLNAAGQYLPAAPLQLTSTATSVRVRNGKPLVTDGPFAETREQLGGYFLIDAKNVDEAVAVAARIPLARTGTVEVRPIVEIPGLPVDRAPSRST